MEDVSEESSEARTFKRQFSLLCSVIQHEREAIATELYSQGMISDGTRDKAYNGRVQQFLADVECKIKTDSNYFHRFVAVLEKMQPLSGLASRLAEDHRRLSTPTTAAVAVCRSFDHRAVGDDHHAVGEAACTSFQNLRPNVATASDDFVPESETGNQGRIGHDDLHVSVSPHPETTPLASGLHVRFREMEEYVANNYVERPEAELQAKKVETLSIQLRDTKLQLNKKDAMVLELKAEILDCQKDQNHLVRSWRTEGDALRAKVLELEAAQCKAAKQHAGAINCVERPESESQAKQIEILSSQLRDMEIELHKKDMMVSKLTAKIEKCKQHAQCNHTRSQSWPIAK